MDGGVTAGCNRRGQGGGVRERILAVLRRVGHPLSPKEIAKYAGISHNTVKPYLRRMLERGEVTQPFRGFYTVPTSGVGGVPRVHWCLVVSEGGVVGRGEGGFMKREIGDVELGVRLGRKRGKISAWIRCPRGLEPRAFLLALDLLRGMIREVSGCEIDDSELFVVQIHINNDVRGVLAEIGGKGAKISVQRVKGIIHQLYQKEDGLVRSETIVNGPFTVEILKEAFIDLTTGKIGQSDIFAQIYRLERQADTIIDALKFLNSKVGSLSRSMEKMVEIQQAQLELLSQHQEFLVQFLFSGWGRGSRVTGGWVN